LKIGSKLPGNFRGVKIMQKFSFNQEFPYHTLCRDMKYIVLILSDCLHPSDDSSPGNNNHRQVLKKKLKIKFSKKKGEGARRGTLYGG